VIERMARNPTRGQVYWFLWDAHDTILVRTQGRPIAWKAILKDIQALGLTNAHAQLVTNADSLRKTWARVRADKRREAEATQQRAAQRRRPMNEPPLVVVRTVAPPQPRPSVNPAPLQIVPLPRTVIEEEARRAAARRPDLFPNGPDVTRYKLLKGRRDV
jgi:hypothetical protein